MTTNSVNNTTFDNLGLALKQDTTKSSGAIGQDQFLQLMVTQLKNQDPTKPLDSGAFLGQLAQFGTVSGIQQMQTSLSDLSTSLRSNQALMASGLVGRTVLAPGNVGALTAGVGLGGMLDLPSSASDVAVSITDSSGQLVQRLSLGSQVAGQVPFFWDGTMTNGAAAAPGQYKISAQALSGSDKYAVNTNVLSHVDSVSLGDPKGMMLNLSGLGPVLVSDVKQIY
jgi:flagellar basal-body rod modification protein FlgD